MKKIFLLLLILIPLFLLSKDKTGWDHLSDRENYERQAKRHRELDQEYSVNNSFPNSLFFVPVGFALGVIVWYVLNKNQREKEAYEKLMLGNYQTNFFPKDNYQPTDIFLQSQRK